MESLKKYSEIKEPDIRQTRFRTVNGKTGESNERTLKDLYLVAESIKLNDNVPEKVRDHFTTSLNLLVYSWFHYPFNVTAQFLAYVTVEMALKEIYVPKKHTSFSMLVKKAVADGLVKDEGFSHINLDKENKLKTEDLAKNIKPYVETLAEVLPKLRNSLAHGSSMLHPIGASSVQICADFINQLYSNNESIKC